MKPQSSGRGSRRGGRGRSRRRTGDARMRPEQNGGPRMAPKKGFWAKLAAFFSGNNKNSQPARAAVSRNGSATRAEAQPRPARKPESIEVTTPRLYVGNLSFEATESDLFDLFNGVGEVQNAEVVTYKHNQRSKGFAFVQMHTVDEAKRAVAELHDKEFLGRKLVVSGAKASDHVRS